MEKIIHFFESNKERQPKYLFESNKRLRTLIEIYTEKKDLIESKKMICLNDFL